MNQVVKATVISNFAAVQCLDLLRATLGSLYLPLEVYQEIQAGYAAGYGFYAGIEQQISPFASDGWLHLVTMTEDELTMLPSLPNRLHLGEAACLCIARQRGWGFLTDDRAARKQAWEIVFSGTLGILVLAIQDRHINLDDGNILLQTMIQRANYRSPVTDLQALLQ
ncbi:DUF3368 domain-containing protein [soil metagenome]